MPDEFTPTKVVKLAKPGEIAGYGRAIRKDAIDPDYLEAAKLAYDNPGKPVVVHAWALPGDEEEKAKAIRRYINQEVRITLTLLNEQDHRDEVADWPEGIDLTIERFQVSQSSSPDGDAVRSYVQFHPEGRSIRKRRAKADEDANDTTTGLGGLPAATFEGGAV